ncbi:MAG: hypothetical protein JWR26_3339 [Pedosphaera sp.]|nr:hypothetical protein [Pedosphaera sp.]
MLDTQVKVTPPVGLTRKILLRILSFLLVAVIIGCVTSFFTNMTNKDPGPAGFGRGILHGALMPCALPNLLVGRDVTIYALNNTGRTYKLGYTVGVNGCGAIFFGVFFWRVNRWRKRMKRATAFRPDAQ